MKNKIDEIEKRLEKIEFKLKTSVDYLSIPSFCSLKGLNVDISRENILGRKCSKLSRELEYDIGKINDQRYGQVNTYHIDVLNEIIE